MTRVFLLHLVLAGIAGAGELKIVGEARVAPYRMVKLSADGVAPEAAVLWDVYPEEQADIVEASGRLLFVAPPGTYKIKLRTIKGGVVETARLVVTIGDAPAPAPGKDRYGLIKASRDGLATVPTQSSPQAAALAGWHRLLAAHVASGGYPDATAILAAWRTGNGERVTSADWQTWGKAVSAVLQTAYQEGKIKGNQDWAWAFEDIASGLEGK